MEPFISAPRPIKRSRLTAKLNRDKRGRGIINTPDMLASVVRDDCTDRLIELLSDGGDARIALDPESGLNKYFSAPYPRRTLAYASSTANDMSEDAFAHLRVVLGQGLPAYSDHLERLRGRIRAAYALADDIEIVFAPSGTDLEYVALAAVLGKAPGGIHNILLGADEVGSGCIHSAHGRFFAGETALGIATSPGTPIEGFGYVDLADVPVRSGEGEALDSAAISASIAQEIERAHAQGLHPLVHVVHGSKTGLILPEPAELEALGDRFGSGVDFVVDACQARITIAALHAYLDTGAMVFLTGSKFMGGPPFNGFALVPRAMMEAAAPLPTGLGQVFRQAEFPAGWPGADCLGQGDNPGLALRYEASIFELERFQKLPIDEVAALLKLFETALKEEVVEPLGLRLVRPFAEGHENEPRENPIEMRTLATLDVSMLAATPGFDDAQQLHRQLALNGLRLGQPVKCVRLNGGWGGTLRVGLSMPQVVRLCGFAPDEAQASLCADMRKIAATLRSS